MTTYRGISPDLESQIAGRIIPRWGFDGTVCEERRCLVQFCLVSGRASPGMGQFVTSLPIIFPEAPRRTFFGAVQKHQAARHMLSLGRHGKLVAKDCKVVLGDSWIVSDFDGVFVGNNQGKRVQVA